MYCSQQQQPLQSFESLCVSFLICVGDLSLNLRLLNFCRSFVCVSLWLSVTSASNWTPTQTLGPHHRAAHNGSRHVDNAGGPQLFPDWVQHWYSWVWMCLDISKVRSRSQSHCWSLSGTGRGTMWCQFFSSVFNKGYLLSDPQIKTKTRPPPTGLTLSISIMLSHLA